MKLGSLWNKCGYTTEWFAQDLRKYGHLIKWAGYKEDILEVGCGNGLTTRTITYPYIRDNLNKLLAIDKDQSMIDAAREHDDIDRIEYRNMDVTDKAKVEQLKSKFDKIFLPMVAHWIPDNRILLQRVRTMLKPNGQIFASIVANSPFHHTFHNTQKAWAKYLPDEVVVHNYTADPENYFTELATSTGFQVEICKNQHYIQPLESILDNIRATMFLYDKIHLIPEELQEDYYLDFVRAWYEISPDKFQLPYERMVCVASRID